MTHLLHVRTTHESHLGPTFHVSLDWGPEVIGPTEDAATAKLLGRPASSRAIVNYKKGNGRDAGTEWDRVLLSGDI